MPKHRRREQARPLAPPPTLEPVGSLVCDVARVDANSRVLLLEGQVRDAAREIDRMCNELDVMRKCELRRVTSFANAGGTTDIHPNFGRLLVDLGYKRLYLASARTVVNSVPLWSTQRPCNEARVDEIVRAKASAPQFIGAVACFEFAGSVGQASVLCPQPRGIFDGQHRICAAAKLLAPADGLSFTESSGFSESAGCTAGSVDGAADGAACVAAYDAASKCARVTCLRPRRAAAPRPGAPSMGGRPIAEALSLYDDFELLVEVYCVKSTSEIRALYLEVNKAESVKEIDLPDAIAPAKKGVIDEAVDELMRRNAEMFRPSERCRPPHMQRDTLRNRLFQHPATESVETAADLLKMLQQINGHLAARPRSDWPPRLHKPLEKAQHHSFWLGLDDYAWLDLLP